jgi:hypothetical protein
MKRLGIIGGIGPESTVVYYRALVAAGRERFGGATPPILINSIDVGKVLRLAEEDPVPGLRDYLLSEIAVLARGGVSIGLIAANTPHIAAQVGPLIVMLHKGDQGAIETGMRFMVIANDYFSGVNAKQLTDGLDTFFADYRNRQLRVTFAVLVVLSTISGMPLKEVDEWTEDLRRGSRK